ncbi:hypothetical protein DCS_01316 [Drechmeria coniospora]|uniref:Uncharacterized protein n=1 Tax=Drechmeria coniospora TaxID=98403 RepID=A0A151GSY8_DRECN|nr:hypothetical protein DCS_01316 [Drechmeria coniospora]KYK60181.1 hypothetical protein DCS_01316 [Drechmeria coniospora]
MKFFGGSKKPSSAVLPHEIVHIQQVGEKIVGQAHVHLRVHHVHGCVAQGFDQRLVDKIFVVAAPLSTLPAFNRADDVVLVLVLPPQQQIR